MNDAKDRIVEQLDTLTKLVACALLEDKSQQQQIEVLFKGGLPARQIADLVGTTRNTVSVQLTALRKDKRPKRKSTKEI